MNLQRAKKQLYQSCDRHGLRGKRKRRKRRKRRRICTFIPS